MKFFSALLALSLSTQAFSAEKILKTERHFDPETGFEVRVQHKELIYSISDGMSYYLSKMVATVEAEDAKELLNYGVVQFIRGCIFKSKKLEDGSIQRFIHTSRQYYDDWVSFKHPEWVLDSVDQDPVYWSGTEKTGRLGLYRLDDPMDHREPEDQLFVHKHLTDQKKFYVRDMPTGAGQYGEDFQNVSLEFRTCLYRLDDVPTRTSPAGEELQGKELKCHSWKSNFIYDFQSARYQMEDELHPFCLSVN